MAVLTVNTDGGARGNPGPAAVGVVLRVGDQVIEHERCIGEATNNVAEYTGVLDSFAIISPIIALQGITSILFNLDSELVVKQIRGEYRVKDPGLQQLHANVQQELRKLPVPYEFNHVPREQNKAADKLVNHALDTAQ